MTKLAVGTLTALALILPSAALACDHDAQATADCGGGQALQCNHQNQAQPAAATDIERLTIAQVVALKKSGKVQLVDANSESTRAKFGTIPGAVLLSSAGEYDAAKELPKAKDQKLVFYCMCEMCGASHMAADKAKAAGYTHVAVMSEGIKGWRAKGYTVSIPQS